MDLDSLRTELDIMATQWEATIEHVHPDSAVVYRAGATRIREMLAASEPSVWALPSEPGSDVTRVRCDCHEFYWCLRYAAPAGAWEPDIETAAPERDLLPWRTLLLQHGPLTNATPLAQGRDGV